MAMFVNPDNSAFQVALNSEIYVDKTGMLEYTNKVPELMAISNLVVSKPGGLTTSESLASNLPMIIINPIPGQEEENAEFLEENGVGIWIRKNDSAYEIFKDLFLNHEKLETMKKNTENLAKKHSTEDICKIILSQT